VVSRDNFGNVTAAVAGAALLIDLLSSFAAGDALLPRQLRERGYRLVYSNGIIALAAAAVFLIVAFRADTHSLIPLYAVGVVLSFTLAQAGMTRRHLRLREPGWRSGILINGVGALVTGVALLVIVVGKFTGGAWMVAIAILCWSGCCSASRRPTAASCPSSRSRRPPGWPRQSPATRWWC
jgi:hypothetical protein